MSKVFFCYNHQRKADSYIAALVSHGWQETRDPAEARFILTDYLISDDTSRRSKNLEIHKSNGIKVFLYPHAARPNLFWDFEGQSFPTVAELQFVPAIGHLSIMRAYGFPLPIEVVGWGLSSIRPFRPRSRAKRILFAPIHVNSNGYLSGIDKDINAEAFRRVLSLGDDGVEILVRHIGDLRKIGLWKAGGVSYIEGDRDLSTFEIDRSDLVVSHQTFAYLAVARGVPTLMMGERYPTRWGKSDETLRFPCSWDKYKDELLFPLDILEEAPEVISREALRSDRAIVTWKRRLIGSTFDPGLFVSIIERRLNG